jgi:hypothetical protein
MLAGGLYSFTYDHNAFYRKYLNDDNKKYNDKRVKYINYCK